MALEKQAWGRRLFAVLFVAIVAVLVGLVFSLRGGTAAASSAHADGELQSDGGCGFNWRISASPNGGTSVNVLVDVEVISANDIWSMGSFYDLGAYSQTLIEHWDGVSWSVIPSPSPGTRINQLLGVTAVSATEVWAVGYYANIGGQVLTLIMRWNGASWNIVSSPNPGTGDFLYSVDAISANNVWAAGRYDSGVAGNTLIEHWNGATWEVVPSPSTASNQNVLVGIDAVSAGDIWVAGYSTEPGFPSQTLIEHWNGTAWTIISSPNIGTGTNELYAIDGLSPTSVWATGYYNVSGTGYSLTMHWNGSTWTTIPSPSPGTAESSLSQNGLVAVSETEVWASGYYQNTGFGRHGMVLRWDGNFWNEVSTADPGSIEYSFYGIAVLHSMNLWTVGNYYPGTGTSNTLVEHFNDPCSTPTPTNTPTNTPTYTPTSTPTYTPSSTSTPQFTGTSTPVVSSTATSVTNPTICPIQFTDVPVGSTFYSFIRCMACRGIINGYSSGCETGNPCFRPGNNVTRGQVAKIVANSAGFSEPPGAQIFEDVPPGSTFFDYVSRLNARGYVGGYACGGAGEPCVSPHNYPYYRPNGNATRGQISKIVANSAGYADPSGTRLFEDVPDGSTFYDYIQRLANRTIVGGYPCGGVGEPCVGPGALPYFRPNGNATRGQTSKIVANTFFPGCSTP